MRDKYIELIKEYIRVKPQYKFLLDDLKKEVMAVGATEEEFEEAIRQTEGVHKSPLAKFPPESNKTSSKIAEIAEKSKNLQLFSLHTLKTRGKWVGLAAAVILVLISIPVILAPKPEKNVKLANYMQNPTPTEAQKQDLIPVVYANLKPVDADKIFSIKSNTVRLTVTGKPKKEVMGFFPYWMVPKQDQVNLYSLTSVSYFGLDVDGKGNVVTSSDSDNGGGWNMWNDDSFSQFLRRAKNQGIKVYLTFKSFNNSNIEALSQSDEAQKNFIENAIYLVNSKNLNGINIDFEYIGIPSENLRTGFTRLITNLNAELKRQIPNASLTIDTYLVSGSEKDIFNLPILSQNSDAFVIMGYDMHTPNGDPGPVSAMGGSTNIIGYIQNYLEQVGPDKLILAVPYYGYDWPAAENANNSNVNVLPYAEIADTTAKIKLMWDDTSQTPYYNYKDSSGTLRIVHFDNVRSLGIKYDFINQKGLKGVGIWALGYDGQNQDLAKLLIDKFINQ